MSVARLKASVETDAQGQVHVVLPPGVAVPSTDLFVERIGGSLLLISSNSDPCDLMAAGLPLFTNDFMQDRERHVPAA